MQSSTAALEPQVVQIRLIPAQTAEERKRNIIANIVLEGSNSAVPYIDDVIQPSNIAQLQVTTTNVAPDSSKPRLRYFAVGPRTYRLQCPLCRHYADGAVMYASNLKDTSCCLSFLSCVFPVFWIFCLCTWCGLNRGCAPKGLYCNKCGGKLGVEKLK